jgi:centromeric protein E
MAESKNIYVGVRIRPPNALELSLQGGIIWEAESANTVVETPEVSTKSGAEGKRYTYDKVFGPSVTTLDIYKEVAEPVINASLDGYNGTIFAYGQTSSGKTHTLMGSAESPGIIILAIHDIFDRISDNQTLVREYLVRISYIEIYNEVLQDLLKEDGEAKADLRITEDKAKGVTVQGATEVVVRSAEAVLELLAQGEHHRHFAETAMNANSSRSHTLFKTVIESRPIASESLNPKEPAAASNNLRENWGSNASEEAGVTYAIHYALHPSTPSHTLILTLIHTLPYTLSSYTLSSYTLSSYTLSSHNLSSYTIKVLNVERSRPCW